MIPDKHWVLKNKVPIEVDMMTWAKWCAVEKNRVIKQEVVGKLFVSTIFLGIDHNFDPTGDPLLFETMVFSKEGFAEQYQERCSTWDQAVEMHKKAVSWAKGQQKPTLFSMLTDWFKKKP